MSPIVVIVIVALVVLAVCFLFFRGGGEAALDVAVLSQLRQAGSDLSKPHAIEFFMYFPSEPAANSVASKLQGEGFIVNVSASASGKAEWLAFATKLMIPTVAELVRLRGMLTAMSAAEQGTYDGWGTPVVK
jgi:Regulator of ribonuclease activity B